MSDEQEVKPDKPERKIMTPEEREAKIKAAAEAREARERAKAEAAGEAPATAEVSTTEAPEAEAATDGTAPTKPERKIMTPEEREAKIQAAAEARAARERAKAEGGEPPAAEGASEAKPERKVLTDEEKEAKVKAAAEARAARAKAKEEAEAAAAEAAPKEPSHNQPRLDRAIAILKEKIADDVVEESSINENNNHLPTLTIKNEHWYKCAELLKHDSEFQCDYLRNVSGTDHETHMEVVYHMVSIATQHEYCIRVKTDRDQPSVDSVTPIWQTANWNEREIYDLLGIAFPGHPDLRRIMMSDDWVGHPLRKDYVPLDSEV